MPKLRIDVLIKQTPCVRAPSGIPLILASNPFFLQSHFVFPVISPLLFTCGNRNRLSRQDFWVSSKSALGFPGPFCVSKFDAFCPARVDFAWPPVSFFFFSYESYRWSCSLESFFPLALLLRRLLPASFPNEKRRGSLWPRSC